MNSESDKLKRLAANSPELSFELGADRKDLDDLVGTVYVGRYQLDSILGTGGMGVVYKARQVFLDRPVAVKMLKASSIPTKARTRFHQEAKAASALNHPGIVSVIDFGVDDLDRPYMVMEYVEGCTLSDLLAERLTLSVEDVLPVFLEICDALSAAHKKGIVHRDLKPGNIMLVIDDDEEVRVKILDFGIAKALDLQENTLQDLTKTGDALGTPLYMSPEQVESKKVTFRSDLYSLGCTIYACLTGAPPFIGENKIATMEMHCSEQPLSLKEASEGLDFPPGIEPIVMRLLEKNPEDRFASVAQLKDALIAMAIQNGLLPAAEKAGKQAIAGSPPFTDGATTRIPKSLTDSVHSSRATRTSASSTGVKAGNHDSLKDTLDQSSTEPISNQWRTQFWKSDLAERVKTNQAGGVKRLPRPSSPLADPAFGAFCAIVIAVVLIGATAYFVSWKSKTSQPLNHVSDAKDVSSHEHNPKTPTQPKLSPADYIIDQHLASGGKDTNLSLRDQIGISNKGLKNLKRFKLLSSLNLGGTNINDAGVRQVSACPLNTLVLDDNFTVSDFSLFNLGRMPSLQSLSLASTAVTNNGLRYLAQSSSLRRLNLAGNHLITDDGIKNLGPNTSRLQVLFIGNCNISDAAAMDLFLFKDLDTLDLSDNHKLSDRTLQVLQGKTKGLRNLVISKDDISDDGIHALSSYKVLSILDLSFVKLSPRAQRYLATMRKLTHLYLRECHLTTPELQNLRRALPGTRIETGMSLEPVVQ